MMHFLLYVRLGIVMLGCQASICLAYSFPASLPVPAPSPSIVSQSLRELLDTTSIQSTKAFERLGLQTGAGVRAFYTHQALQPVWTTDKGWSVPATKALRVLAAASAYGLRPQEYGWARLQALTDTLGRTPAETQPQLLAAYELTLTDALLRYALHLRHGRLQAATLLPQVYDTVATLQAAQHLKTALLASDFALTFLRFQPDGQAYQRLLAAWHTKLKLLAPDSTVVLDEARQTEFKSVAINLERCRWYTKATPDTAFLLVNIPAYRLDVMGQGRVLRSHRVVVGKPALPTPQFDARLYFFTTAPEWRVPPSIAVQEILPQLRRDPGYLYRHQYHIYNKLGQSMNPYRIKWKTITAENFPYTIRQMPGPDNSLGNVSYYMPNEHTVYLHDTPARKLFAQNQRAFSHGCVRVEQSVELAAFLLRRSGAPERAKRLEQAAAQSWTQRINLPRSWPVQVRYFTCEAGANGQLRHYPDVYGLDAPLLAAFFAEVPVAAQVTPR
ncbi:L,D-transpeptidase family protein [Hymenobacter sp. BT730]|uniref:L,D-transpeptidase family protein n=1 Tax=Hymenobacter sp. BT730 TaxID=3063332 RepID=UPI0026E10F6E|nr:L,D-transpeptidase family protein [Hymenobacter sp. BT730]